MAADCTTLVPANHKKSSGTWVLGTGTAADRTFDFAKCKAIKDGATIASAVVGSSPSGLTFGAAVIVGAKVTFRITTPAVGTAGSSHCIWCLATLSTGAIERIDGCVVVTDC